MAAAAATGGRTGRLGEILALQAPGLPPGEGADAGPATAQAGELLEPLSDRELEVLRLLAAGLSNQEIADRLVVSLGTVKSHAHHIYGKLGAPGRTRAVARAQERGLI